MSPAPAHTSLPEILAAARALLERGGLEALTMAAVAERVGVKAPSLYKRFADRTELIAAVATDVATDLGRTMRAAASDADPAARLAALAIAYRTFALDAPRSTALLFSAVAPGAEPSPQAQAEAARPVLDVAQAIVGPARALAAARVLTAFAHGFTSMEAAGAFRFGGDVEEAYRLGIAALFAGLEGSDARPKRRGAGARDATVADRG
jgi:AcrR family transcriptional regulator